MQRFVDLLLPFFGRCRALLLAGFVLILLGVEFEIEQVRQIAAGSAATAATAAAEGHLNIAESGFCAQQMLQRFGLRLERVLPALRLQFVRRRTHLRRGFLHVLHEGLKFLIRAGQLAAVGALGQRLRLFLQLALHFGKKLRVLGRIYFFLGRRESGSTSPR